MELKSYQQRVIADLESYLGYLDRYRDTAKAFNMYWEDKIGPYDPLTGEGMQPYKNTIPNAAHICIKVPTAGGKTFIACNALHTIFRHYASGTPKVVVWLVPWSNLLDQTVANLRNPAHPYRQKLNMLFQHRVEVYEKKELLQGANFNPSVVTEQLSVIVMSFASLRARNKEDRKVYQQNSQLLSFAGVYNDADSLLGNIDETSLINVIRSLQPVLVVDESHNAESELSIEMLRSLNPSFILDLTATPKDNSNIISLVPAIELKKEHMVKLPVIVYNHHDKTDVISSALHLQKKLELAALEQEKNGGRYIRPIVLFQAQAKTNEDNTTFLKVKNLLLKIGIPEEQIKIKTAEKNELKGIDLMARDCPVRYIITINALREGWDCPFAYVLASLADRSSAVEVEQLLGDEDELARESHVVASADAHDVDEHLAVGDLRQRFREDRLHQFSDVGGGPLEIDRLENRPERIDRSGYLDEIAVHEKRRKAVADDVPGAVIEVADDTEVQEDQLAVGVDHQVAGMNIAMEEPVLQSRLHPGTHPPLQQLREVEPCGPQAVGVIDAVAVDPLHGEDTRGGVSPLNLRHPNPAVGPKGREVLGEALHRLSLENEVELVREGGLEILDDRDRVGHATLRRGPLERPSRKGEDLQVGGKTNANARPLHLDDHVAAVAQRCRMHLRQRRRCQRFVVEGRERLADANAELAFDDVANRNGR